MDNLKIQLQNVRIKRSAEKILASEFLKRGYKKTEYAASHFQTEMEKELPGVNKWILGMNRETGREIEDVVMDELEIPGNI